MKIVLHCSDSTWGNAAEITKWHLKNGWSTIGYHYVILNGNIGPNKVHALFNGSVETGRPIDDDKDFELDETGAHTLGHNDCVGVCLIGKSASFTKEQLYSLRDLLRMLKNQFGSIEVYQHSDFDPVNRPYCAGLTKKQMEDFNKV